MNRALTGLGAAILAVACGCATAIDFGALQRDLNNRFQACLDADMTKTGLVMQVGSPTSKETTDEGEIWIYEITEQGLTVTEGEKGVFGTWTERSYSPEMRYTVSVRFDKDGVMQEIRGRGKAGAAASPNNRFLRLECRPSLGGQGPEEHGGIGIRFSVNEDHTVFTVMEALDGTPAQKAGILAGDQVIRIDDLPTKGMTAKEFAGIVRGKPGTRVTLLVRRAGFEAPREFTMPRALLPVR